MDWFGSPTTNSLACEKACRFQLLPQVACAGLRLCLLFAVHDGPLTLKHAL